MTRDVYSQREPSKWSPESKPSLCPSGTLVLHRSGLVWKSFRSIGVDVHQESPDGSDEAEASRSN